MHKFGVRLPKSVREAYKIDKKNGNDLWTKAVSREIMDVKVAFKSIEEGENVLIGYTFVRCHMIFYVNMEDFCRKAHPVAGGRLTDTPATITYTSVFFRETVCLDLLIAALNDLEVKCGDVMNVYTTDPIEEKIWTTLGPKFGPDTGKRSLVVRSMYGLKSTGYASRVHLGRCMQGLVY